MGETFWRIDGGFESGLNAVNNGIVKQLSKMIGSIYEGDFAVNVEKIAVEAIYYRPIL